MRFSGSLQVEWSGKAAGVECFVKRHTVAGIVFVYSNPAVAQFVARAVIVEKVLRVHHRSQACRGALATKGLRLVRR